MKTDSIEAIFQALNDGGVRYLVVGGLAVVAHGYVRFTADVDLMLALDDQNLSAAITALKTLGYRPRAPVAMEEFLDPDKRKSWIAEKGAVVFSLDSAIHPATQIDLFLDPPIDFEKALANSLRQRIGSGTEVAFCGIDDLMEMKTKAGRPRDIEDIARLRQLRERKS